MFSVLLKVVYPDVFDHLASNRSTVDAILWPICFLDEYRMINRVPSPVIQSRNIFADEIELSRPFGDLLIPCYVALISLTVSISKKMKSAFGQIKIEAAVMVF